MSLFAPGPERFIARPPGWVPRGAPPAETVAPFISSSLSPSLSSSPSLLSGEAIPERTASERTASVPSAFEPSAVVPDAFAWPMDSAPSAGFADFAELASFVSSPNVTDVFANGPDELWVDRGNGLERQRGLKLDESGLRELAVRLIALGGRHIDEASPCVDVRLNDGIRIHAVLPPISTHGTLLSIRLPGARRMSLADLESAGLFELVPLGTLTALIAARKNVLISGASGSGKTTLLGAILGAAEPTERIIAIEDVAELRVEHPHFVSLEARQANLEGAGQLGLERLVREALRMRPDRLVLGECRGAEIRELLAALNTGHDGGAGTLHANSLADVPARIEALGALAGLSPTAIARQTVSAIGAVLHLERVGGIRRLAQVGRFALDERDRLVMVDSDGA